MSHPKRSGEVSHRAPTVSSRTMHALWAALSPGVYLVGCGVWECVGSTGAVSAARDSAQATDTPSASNAALGSHSSRGSRRALILASSLQKTHRS